MTSELRIVTGYRSGSTFLQEGYYTRPFKLADVGIYRADKALCLMLMTASPGMLDGDNYHMAVTVSAHTRLQLQTQAYQRLFTMQQGAAQHITVHVQQGACFSYVPHPVVPHAGASFEGHNRITLEQGCRLVWGEILTCGRKLNGEAFQFKQFHNLTELYYQGRLVLKDNLLLQPERINVTAFGQMEGYTHQATLIYADTRTAAAPVADRLLHILAPETGIAYGVSQTAGPALVLRVLGHGAEQLYNCLKKMESLLWEEAPVLT
ncbi:MAG TPA: urease accessory protein UreD [Chitinophaga sp.]|uniref:urease accessory protein UreD n=1 Tax=Chitinophaga sp. TaxID=1869181 RepID=UPI002DBFAB13|nr:urease accessory protein UreD [Chitinophaga sp.]HEU4551889.1 urease accessory protein UreD [Chitinophaga sp.]